VNLHPLTADIFLLLICGVLQAARTPPGLHRLQDRSDWGLSWLWEVLGQ